MKNTLLRVKKGHTQEKSRLKKTHIHEDSRPEDLRRLKDKNTDNIFCRVEKTRGYTFSSH